MSSSQAWEGSQLSCLSWLLLSPPSFSSGFHRGPGSLQAKRLAEGSHGGGVAPIWALAPHMCLSEGKLGALACPGPVITQSPLLSTPRAEGVRPGGSANSGFASNLEPPRLPKEMPLSLPLSHPIPLSSVSPRPIPSPCHPPNSAHAGSAPRHLLSDPRLLALHLLHKWLFPDPTGDTYLLGMDTRPAACYP